MKRRCLDVHQEIFQGLWQSQKFYVWLFPLSTLQLRPLHKYNNWVRLYQRLDSELCVGIHSFSSVILVRRGCVESQGMNGLISQLLAESTIDELVLANPGYARKQ